MNILFAAATALEIAPLLEECRPFCTDEQAGLYLKDNNLLNICITGIGPIATTYALCKVLPTSRFDLAIQAGIAGTFSDDIPIGSVWQVKNEILADLGAEEKDGTFTDLFDMGFLKPGHFPFKEKKLTAPSFDFPFLNSIPAADGITVNTVSGLPNRNKQRADKYHSSLESMEGAAFHYTCLMEGINFFQLRSISNKAGIRDKSKWNIPLAVTELNKALIQLVNHLPLS